MSEQTNTPEKVTVSKKTSITKKIFFVIAFILGLLGLDYFTYNFTGIGTSVTVTDSTIVISTVPDTVIPVPVVVSTATKTDTLIKP